MRPCPPQKSAGFTLIELSIVLVIIGLIIGGILVGRDMIRASAVRATISQVEKYNTAVNAFKLKYNCLPGDCRNAAEFGFIARGLYAGQGDGNGVIEGSACGSGCNYGYAVSAGETVVFWMDLSAATFIDGNFKTAGIVGPGTDITTAQLPLYFPPAKLGDGNFITVFSGGGATGAGAADGSYQAGINYFNITKFDSVSASSCIGCIHVTQPGLSAQQAYAIDSKLDDGLPLTGTVRAAYAGSMWINFAPGGAGANNSGSCYANGNVPGAQAEYSVKYDGVQCSLAIRFQ